MKFTITGSLGNISKPVVETLTKAGHEVKVISSDLKKKEAVEALNATAAIGSIEDIDFLTEAFTDADAVYTMVPPHFGAVNWKKHIAYIGENYAEAIKRSGVKNVVNLSSIGAHLPEGAGPVSGLYHVEQALDKLENVNVLHLRAGFFYTNFYGSATTIKEHGIMAGNYGENAELVMVNPADIAKEVAKSLLEMSFKGKTIRYVVSDIHTTNEVAAIFGKAVGKPIQWINASDESALDAMLQSGLSNEIASNYVEMGKAVRTGKLFEDFNKSSSKSDVEKTPLEDFAKVFAESI